MRNWRLPIMAFISLAAIAFAGSGSRTVHSSSINNFSSRATFESDVSGDYSVTGYSGSGVDYQGDLRIEKQGAVYQLHWWAGNQFEGVGVMSGNYLAVSYADDADNVEDCGVVIYRILNNGTLDGLWGLYGEDQLGTEHAVHTRGPGLTGSYNANGTDMSGHSYKTPLTITEKGVGFELIWGQQRGFGVRRGNTLSVAYGGEQCSWVAYEVKPNGELDGLWGGYGASAAGRERAVPK